MPLLNFTFTFVGFAWARFINVTPRQDVCQRAKYSHKNSFIFFKSHHSFTSFSLSYALTIASYDSSYAFPFTHDFRTGKAILLVYGRQDRYWYKRAKNAY